MNSVINNTRLSTIRLEDIRHTGLGEPTFFRDKSLIPTYWIALTIWLAPLCIAARPVGMIAGGPVTANGVSMDAVGVVSWTVLTGDEIANVGPAVLKLQSGGRAYLGAQSTIRVEDSILELIKGHTFVSCTQKGFLTVIAANRVVYTEAITRAEIYIDASGTVTIIPGKKAPKLDISGSQLERREPYIWGGYFPDESETKFLDPPGDVNLPATFSGLVIVVFVIVTLWSFITRTMSRPIATPGKTQPVNPPATSDVSDLLHDTEITRIANELRSLVIKLTMYRPLATPRTTQRINPLRSQEAPWRVHENLYYPKSQRKSGSSR